MSGNLSSLGFDARTEKPNDERSAMPKGEYEFVFVEQEVKPTKAGNGKILAMVAQVLNGQYQNRKVFINLNIENPSAEAQKIARGELSCICRAIGVNTPQDGSELLHKPFKAKVKVNTDGFNEFVGGSFKPRHAGPPANSQAAQPAGNPVTPPQNGGNVGNPWGQAG